MESETTTNTARELRALTAAWCRSRHLRQTERNAVLHQLARAILLTIPEEPAQPNQPQIPKESATWPRKPSAALRD
jgi:hypothetical protein